MDPFEWEPEYYDGGEDYSEDWGDPEAFPGFPGLPRRLSPSTALARRFYPQRRRPIPPRPPVRRPVSVATAPTPVAAIRQLEDRQQSIAAQLAQYQQRIAAQQSSDQFGPMATGAVGALALGFRSGDLFSPAIVNALPLAQLLLQTRGQAISAGFRANPWATFGFPAAALLLTAFRENIPGLAPKVVAAPVFTITTEPGATAGTRNLLVVVTRPQGAVVRFTTASSALLPSDPTDQSPESGGFHPLQPGESLKLRAFADGVASDTVTVANPPLARFNTGTGVTGPITGGVIGQP